VKVQAQATRGAEPAAAANSSRDRPACIMKVNVKRKKVKRRSTGSNRELPGPRYNLERWEFPAMPGPKDDISRVT
jgi:hypothetical protein